MDQVESGFVEFLDLSGVEDQERNWILSTLHSRNPYIQLPWAEASIEPQQSYRKQKYINAQAILNEGAQINPQQRVVYVEQYVPHATVYMQQVSLPNLGYLEPAQIVQAPYIITNDIQTVYNSDQGYNNCIGQYNSLENFDEPVDRNGGELYDFVDQNEMCEEQESGELAPDHEENSPAAKSWASLFNKSGGFEANADTRQEYNSLKPSALVPPFVSKSNDAKQSTAEQVLSLKEPFKSNVDDPNLHRMGEFLSSQEVDNRINSLQPRGLINRSNYCYINSILQAVLACPPFYNLLTGLAENTSPSTEKKKITPTINSMTRFTKEFHHLPAGLRVSRRLDKNQKKEHSVLINCDTPFEPFWIHKLLSGIRSDTFVVEGRQEDAEEFLGCLLNGLNDEMLELIKLVGGHQIPDDSNNTDKNSSSELDKEWQVMGPKNKGAITRRTEFSRTPISDIFGGLLRSRLHRAGDQSTDNIQPFFTLQLNIEKTTTVREALEALACKNQIEGVTSSKTNEEVEAWQQVTIEELPIVLVLHLKCFDYKLDGCSKIIKALEFPIDLKIDMRLLSSKMNYTAKERQYKLFAVVYHEGKEATKGHYLTDAYHVGYASWLRYDDASVKSVPEEHVLKPQGTRVPYLLFYRRSDALSKK